MSYDMPPVFLTKATVTRQKVLTQGIFWIDLRCPEIAELALPGQFAHVRVDSAGGPLLRRPFSFSRIDRPSGSLSILYQVIGKGTRFLSQRKESETLDLLGPLGKPFSFPRSENLYLVGGGVGAAPLLPLAQTLAKERKYPLLLLGFKEGPSFPNALSEQLEGIRLLIATEDGSVGKKGLVTKFLTEIVRGKDEFIYACGPRPMLKKVEEIAGRLSIPGEISLEERMGCGIGVCKGCVIKVRTNGGSSYERVCCDGPTFPFGETVYE